MEVTNHGAGVSPKSGSTRLMAAGRPNQKSRTRKDLLRAAARLMQAGEEPDAGGGRRRGARVARHRLSLFPGRRGAADRGGARPRHARGESFFAGDPSAEPLERLLRADAAVAEMIRAQRAGAARDADPQPPAGPRRRPSLAAPPEPPHPADRGRARPRRRFAPGSTTASPRRSPSSSAPNRCSPSRTCWRLADDEADARAPLDDPRARRGGAQA